MKKISRIIKTNLPIIIYNSITKSKLRVVEVDAVFMAEIKCRVGCWLNRKNVIQDITEQEIDDMIKERVTRYKADQTAIIKRVEQLKKQGKFAFDLNKETKKIKEGIAKILSY